MVDAGDHQLVPVNEIVLDRSNPRIRKFLEMYGDAPTPEQIFLALGAGNDEDSGTTTSTTYEKLKQSILSNGGIIQPVILNRRSDGKLICVEGNTRVALYRHFLDTDVRGNWTSYVRKLVTELSGGVFGYLDSVLERHSFDEFGELI